MPLFWGGLWFVLLVFFLAFFSSPLTSIIGPFLRRPDWHWCVFGFALLLLPPLPLPSRYFTCPIWVYFFSLFFGGHIQLGDSMPGRTFHLLLFLFVCVCVWLCWWKVKESVLQNFCLSNRFYEHGTGKMNVICSGCCHCVMRTFACLKRLHCHFSFLRRKTLKKSFLNVFFRVACVSLRKNHALHFLIYANLFFLYLFIIFPLSRLFR